MCTVRFESRIRIILANFESLLATVGRLEVMVQANPERMEAGAEEMEPYLKEMK
jgi:hypothetical protein